MWEKMAELISSEEVRPYGVFWLQNERVAGANGYYKTMNAEHMSLIDKCNER